MTFGRCHPLGRVRPSLNRASGSYSHVEHFGLEVQGGPMFRQLFAGHSRHYQIGEQQMDGAWVMFLDIQGLAGALDLLTKEL
jgi:hypothetical protein